MVITNDSPEETRLYKHAHIPHKNGPQQTGHNTEKEDKSEVIHTTYKGQGCIGVGWVLSIIYHCSGNGVEAYMRE